MRLQAILPSGVGDSLQYEYEGGHQVQASSTDNNYIFVELAFELRTQWFADTATFCQDNDNPGRSPYLKQLVMALHR